MLLKNIRRLPRRTRRGRRADKLAPRDLPAPILCCIRTMVQAGESAVYIFAALRLYHHGVKIDTLRKFVRALKSPFAPSNEAMANTPDVLADVIVRWLCAGLSTNAIDMTLRRARKLAGLRSHGRPQ